MKTGLFIFMTTLGISLIFLKFLRWKRRLSDATVKSCEKTCIAAPHPHLSFQISLQSHIKH